MAHLFNEALYRPLLNLLFFIYNNAFSDLGIAIIILTLVIRFLLLPLFYKSAKDQTILQSLAPKIREIQKKHKDNKEQQVSEIMNVYKEHKVNPFSGFLLIIVQLPILIALYRVFLKGFSNGVLEQLYSFIPAPEIIHNSFLGIINLDERNLILVFLAALLQYAQSALLLRVAKKKANSSTEGAVAMAENISRKMLLFTPLITIVILYSLPSAVALYWLTTSAFSAVQQVIINKKININNGGNTEKQSGDSINTPNT